MDLIILALNMNLDMSSTRGLGANSRIQGRAKMFPLSSVRMDEESSVLMGCALAEVRRANSNMQEFLCTTLCTSWSSTVVGFRLETGD